MSGPRGETRETVVIDTRHCGPPESGNGGYSAGLLGTRLPGTPEVRLHRPPPLDRPLTLRLAGGELLDGETVVASARPGAIEGELPPAPTLAEASAAARDYLGFEAHTFPTCFVCGPARSPADGGLCIYPGPVPGAERVAAPWQPADTLADESGHVRPVYLWSALDCPSGFGAMGRNPAPVVLGTITVQIAAPLPAGQPCVVAGWPIRRSGRKHYAGSAIYTADGEPVARASTIWIAL
ncbi:hypothetical protein [Lentisalinibacter sediminis]|uniref:hypothetical protein n=1 Tax=Lentisalinibacter sediminis TaxID=2992237 RepID=UPI003869745D